MDTFDAIRTRRSITRYDPNHTMTDEEITTLISAAMLSPTSFNAQHWRFVVITNKTQRTEMRAAALDQPQVTDASLLIAMTADLKAYRKEPARYWRNAPEDIRNMLSGWMVPFYNGKPELERDEAMRSIGIAAQTIMLAATAMGYQTCPMIGYDPALIAQSLNLPSDHVLGMLIAVGKATHKPWPRPGQLPISEVLIRNRFAEVHTPFQPTMAAAAASTTHPPSPHPPPHPQPQASARTAPGHGSCSAAPSKAQPPLEKSGTHPSAAAWAPAHPHPPSAPTAHLQPRTPVAPHPPAPQAPHGSQ